MLAIQLCHNKVKRGKGSGTFAYSANIYLFDSKITIPLKPIVKSKFMFAQAIQDLVENGNSIPTKIPLAHSKNDKGNQTQPLTTIITVAPTFAKTTVTIVINWTSCLSPLAAAFQ